MHTVLSWLAWLGLLGRPWPGPPRLLDPVPSCSRNLFAYRVGAIHIQHPINT